MDKDIAISVNNVSKTFHIPHEKISSLRGAFVNLFRSNGYEEFKALDDVSFEVKKGEFFGIIGRNGSGKSTLLKIMAGIYQPDKRKDKIKGKVKVSGLISPFLELGIGFNPELSGRDNVYLNATVLGLTHKQIDEKFDDIVEFSELRRFIDQKVKNYSSGMQVRLMFSVAIHANREILLMDEVLAVGDTNFQSKCLEEFNKYKDQGKTVVLVTHDIGTVKRYCDRAMLLRNGKIEMIGKSEEVGNEYIYQNMSDEEKRIVEEEKKQSKIVENAIKDNNKAKASKIEVQKEICGIPIKEKIAQILSVNLSDETGKVKNVFETNQIINIKVEYGISRDLTNPIFGLIINDSNKRPIFITNTEFKKIETGIIKKGITEVTFSLENDLAEGLCYISPAIAGEGAKVFYDWKDNFKTLRVINTKYNSGGLVDFKHKIEIKAKN
jgi:ABC-2 type transport system ATP-binding protein